MDTSIERRFAVYLTARRSFMGCPRDQVPADAQIVFEGTQHACERYMRQNRPCKNSPTS